MDKNQKKQIKRLETKLDFLKEETLSLQFRINERTDDSIRLSVKFFDLDGVVLSKHDVAIGGKELFFDFIVLKEDDRFVAFPYLIFSDEIAPDQGVDLSTMYVRDGLPEIFTYSAISRRQKDALIQLMKKINAHDYDKFDDQFGSAVHDIKQIKNFQTGTVYSIISHTKGGLEIKQLWVVDS